MKIYFDTEFTGLHQNTTLISIGMIAEDGRSFYAEFSDYDKKQVDKWIQKNVINNLKFNNITGLWSKQTPNKPTNEYSLEIKGDNIEIMIELKNWFEKFEDVELIADGFISYDYDLINKLFNNDLPFNVEFNRKNLRDTLFLWGLKINDFDIPLKIMEQWGKRGHNALEDAVVIKKCYEKCNFKKGSD